MKNIIKAMHHVGKTFFKKSIDIVNTIIKKPVKKITPQAASGILFKLLYLMIFFILLFNIASYSHDAFLYPMRKGLYFDECSYISMAKFFRTIPPADIVKNHFLKNRPLPNLYNEFNCRLLFYPLLLSYPLTYTDNITKLHEFRTLIMVIGTIIFFLVGFKLSGISGGVLASVFWIGTPLLNYWGHFFMTESPSFVLLAAGYLFLLNSDKSRITSFFGGVALGLSCLTRFTTIILMLPAPFILLAVMFNPFRRKNFQLFGELAKMFSAFIITILPYFAFIWILYRDPLVSFSSARIAVENFMVNDPFYYMNNFWLEAGNILKFCVILGIISPVIYAASSVLKAMSKDLNKHEPFLHTGIHDFKISTKKILKFIGTAIKYHKIFLSALIYYSIIILSLAAASSIYLVLISDIPHKLPRYLMGAIIPVIFIGSIGFGVFEPFILNFFKFVGNFFIVYNKKLLGKRRIKYAVIALIAALFAGTLMAYADRTNYIWQKTNLRKFSSQYRVNKYAVDKLVSLNDEYSLKRLQPEYNNWNSSLKERLIDCTLNPDNKYDETDYFGDYNRDILKYIDNIIKPGEVFYIDQLNETPYIPAYTDLPCIYIENSFNYSINQLISTGQLAYRGYILISDNVNDDILEENGVVYTRSINKFAVQASNKFQFIHDFGDDSLYYYPSGDSFSYKFGTKKRIKEFYKNVANDPDCEKPDNKKSSNDFKNKYLKIWKLLFNNKK